MSKKHHKRNKKLKRNVYSCCVLGATGSGKVKKKNLKKWTKWTNENKRNNEIII